MEHRVIYSPRDFDRYVTVTRKAGGLITTKYDRKWCSRRTDLSIGQIIVFGGFGMDLHVGQICEIKETNDGIVPFALVWGRGQSSSMSVRKRGSVVEVDTALIAFGKIAEEDTELGPDQRFLVYDDRACICEKQYMPVLEGLTADTIQDAIQIIDARVKEERDEKIEANKCPDCAELEEKMKGIVFGLLKDELGSVSVCGYEIHKSGKAHLKIQWNPYGTVRNGILKLERGMKYPSLTLREGYETSFRVCKAQWLLQELPFDPEELIANSLERKKEEFLTYIDGQLKKFKDGIPSWTAFQVECRRLYPGRNTHLDYLRFSKKEEDYRFLWEQYQQRNVEE